MPKTPKHSEEASKEQMNQVTSTDLSLYEHEDSPVSFSFQQDELDELESYDMIFDGDNYYEDTDFGDGAGLQELTFPFSVHEPCLAES